MKIAICCEQDKPDSPVSQRFGRAPWISIYNDADKQWKFVSNAQNLNAAQGAGIQTAQNILNCGADVVLACNVGPKAMRVLQGACTKIYKAVGEGNIDMNLQMYLKGNLEIMEQANVEGHWM